jgi:hypothetical protein
MTKLSWLHLTDLHRGMHAQSTIWPNIEDQFFQDLTKLHDICGPWDLLFFSGDLVQSGSSKEYAAFTITMKRLYAHLETLGSNPVLLTVPGNHDLERPKTDNAQTLLLSQWEKQPEVREQFWKKGTSPYRTIINKSLKNYTEWCKTHPFPRPKSEITGRLPGDFSAVVEKDGLSIGVVGLNTTFLQLNSGDFKGRLALNAEQFVDACGEQFNDWFKSRDFAFLMTHQPPDWLDKESQISLNSQIYVPNRFISHIYGHMHEHHSYTINHGGGQSRRNWQGTSLFGLEFVGTERTVERRHGYSAGNILVNSSEAELRLWPRSAEKHQDGHWHIVPDKSVSLENDEGLPAEKFQLPIRITKISEIAKILEKPEVRIKESTFKVKLYSTDFDLEDIRRNISEHLERSIGVEIIKDDIGDDDSSDIAILVQGWRWENGESVQEWKQNISSKKLAFIVSESSDWPPFRLTESNEIENIKSFRSTLDHPTVFNSVALLPELIGEEVTRIIQDASGNSSLGLKAWERAYLDFRLPAWKSGRTAVSRVHLFDTESAEELYQPDLYVGLDGIAENWYCNTSGQPEKIKQKKRQKSGFIETSPQKRRVPLAKWLSTPELPRLVLVGAPGGGKTVFLTRIAATLANACLGRPVDIEPDFDVGSLRDICGSLPIPVVIEATRFTGSDSIDVNYLVDIIASEIACHGIRPDPTEIYNGLKEARYLLLIDALDEIAGSENRINLLNLLKGIATRDVFPNTRMLMTTRSARYTGSLRFAPELETVVVSPLDDSQVQQLCTNWATHRQRNEEYRANLMSAVSGLANNVSSSPQDQAITENPLMLTAICMVFERYRSLPDDRGRLCDLLIDDLCRSRLSEDAQRRWKLDDAGKKDLLQRIALTMQQEGLQTLPYERAIEIALENVPQNDEFRRNKATKYLDWSADHTGLLKFQQSEDGKEHIRFWHRLFREYLCAHQLAQIDTTASEKISDLWDSGRLTNPFWEDVIRLLPRTLGTREKAKSIREKLESLAQQHSKQRGRLIGLAAAGIIENRDLYLDIDYHEMAVSMAALYNNEGLSWPLHDRLLFLEGLGRLDPKFNDPRILLDKWVDIPQGNVTISYNGRNKRSISVPSFQLAWAPVTVQQFAEFVNSDDYSNPFFWQDKHIPSEKSLLLRQQHPNWPVTNITFYEATAYCKWRTSVYNNDKVLMLPSVAAWIRFRVDLQKLKYTYFKKNHDVYDSYENKINLGFGLPTPVGAFPPQKWGATDILGNVWEWLGDRPLGPEYADSLTRTYGPVEHYIVHGGGYNIPLDVAVREITTFSPTFEDSQSPVIGFRPILVDKSKAEFFNPSTVDMYKSGLALNDN